MKQSKKQKKLLNQKIIQIKILLIVLNYIFSFISLIKPPLKQEENKVLEIALCTMGKNENLYIEEYINYYRKLGVDKIFIYDDNEPNTEKFSDIINSTNFKYVKIYENIKSYIHNQSEAFTSCYNENKMNFGWFIMVDMDEFLYIVNDYSVKMYIYLKTF